MAEQPASSPTIHFSRILIDLGRYIQGINLNRIIDGLVLENILPGEIAVPLKNVEDEFEKSNIVVQVLQGKKEKEFKTFLKIVALEERDSKFYEATEMFFSGFTKFRGYEQYASW